MEEPTVAQTTPSGEATGGSEEVIKVKSPEKTWESSKEPIASTSLLTIDTSLLEKKNITEMSPTKLMMMASQKLMEKTTDKGIIDQSITVLHRLVPKCKIENEESPFGKLKAIIEHISKYFQSLQQISNRLALEKSTLAKRAAFDQIIDKEKKKIEENIILIENYLKQDTNIFRVCCNTNILTPKIDEKIKEVQDKIANIANSFDGLISLTTSIDGQILTLENQMSSL